MWRARGRELRVWGTTRTIPTFCFVLEVAAPGLLVVKHHRGEGGKFVNVAVLEGDQVKVIDEQASSLPDCPALLTSLLGLRRAGRVDGVGQRARAARRVDARARPRRILLVVPPASDDWRESIVRPISYAVVPAFRRARRRWRAARPSDEDDAARLAGRA